MTMRQGQYARTFRRASWLVFLLVFACGCAPDGDLPEIEAGTSRTSINNVSLVMSGAVEAAIARYSASRLVYRRDNWGQQRLEPHEFLASQTGDCDSYARLNWHLLQAAGRQAFLFLVVFEGNVAHLVAAVKDVEGNGYGYLDVDGKYRLAGKTHEELALAVARHHLRRLKRYGEIRLDESRPLGWAWRWCVTPH